MKNFKLTALVLGAALVPAAAQAADMPQYDTPAVADMTPDTYLQPKWNGFYVGINGGYGMSSMDTVGRGPNLANSGFANWLDFDDVDGFLIGGQIGVNWQLSNGFVIGAELDADYFNAKQTNRATIAVAGPPQFTGTASLEFKQTWLATARLRAGFAMDSLLLYATGGLAGAGTKITGSYNLTTPVASGSTSETGTDFGWTIGAGAEYMVTDNFSLRGEYLYVDLGSDVLDFGSGDELEADYSMHIVRAGVNYHF